jgi:anti-sigma-K factor RskA
LNLQEYISSGILETYLLGDGTPEERAEVERLAVRHHEVREELRKIEEAMEDLAMKGAMNPKPEVKDSIMAGVEARVVSISSARFNGWKYAAAASIIMALTASYLAISYHGLWKNSEAALHNLIAQNRSMAQNYNTVNERLNKLQGDVAIIENVAFKKVVMSGTQNDKNALASVYWNESTKEVYVSIQRLKEISKENQFQLWAIVNGKPVDAGVFDKDFSGLMKMKNISGAAAFAVTVEPRGGKESPTLETMQVIGAVDRRKS